jgi:hypothetical protein
MDSLSLLVLIIGSALAALVVLLGVIDYINPDTDVKLGGIYSLRRPRRYG